MDIDIDLLPHTVHKQNLKLTSQLVQFDVPEAQQSAVLKHITLTHCLLQYQSLLNPVFIEAIYSTRLIQVFLTNTT